MKPVPEAPVLPHVPTKNFDGILRFTTTLVKVLTELIHSTAYRLNRVLAKDGSEGMEGPLPLKAYTTRPTASSHTGAIIYVSNAAAGQKFQGSDGSNWVALG